MKKELLILTGFFALVSYSFADDITVSVDSYSSYSPTAIVNGSFENGANQTSEYHPGTGNGWGTTDPGGFERSSSMSTYGWSGYSAASGSYFVEMNATKDSILYQDLKTYSNDVIRWTLAHATRQGSWGDPQAMHVEIGASDGNNPSGYGSSKNTHIVSSTLGKYYPTYVSGYNCYANTSELAALSLAQSLKSSTDYSSKCWYKATGIYIIPENQTVTRFAFISDNSSYPGGGNLLDDITFSTLIGNLNAYAEWDSTIVITGYWGETDTSKKLTVNFGDSSTQQVDMSSVTGKNFKIVIPASIVGDAESVKIYHQDYEAAAKTIVIERHFHDNVLYGVWNYSDRLPETGRYALGTDVTLSADVTLTGSEEMVTYGGAKICLNGHTITGSKVIIDSGEYKFFIESVLSSTETSFGSVTEGIEVKGGDFTLNGGNISSLTFTDGTCTLDGTVNISSLSLASGKTVTIGASLDTGSSVYLSPEIRTGVITSGFAPYNLGAVIILPDDATEYILIKTKSGELKVGKHK